MVLKEGRGKMFVKADGKIFYFCNSKCEKNWKMKREGKKVGWTRAFRKFREKTSASVKEVEKPKPAGKAKK
jgi:large subunit ribosomal protein L24e